MIQILRKFIDSGLGAGIAIVSLIVIALSFAAGDVANLRGSFNGGGDHAAIVGGQKVTSGQVSQAASNAVENLKQKDPRLSMKAFIATGGLEEVLGELLDRTALGVFGKKHGIVASDRLVDSEIAKVSAFRGPDGSFSDTAFRAVLQQRGLSEKAVREDLAQGLISRQIMVPVAAGGFAPLELTSRYAALLRESRTGAIGMLPSAAFAPKTQPTDAQLQAFYTKHRDSFILPERRVLRFATFGEAALKAAPAPTEAEIAARYKANQPQYAALETRRITQLIVPTEAAAKAIVEEVSKGKKLEQAAVAKGLSTSVIGPISKQALSGQASQAVADASFAAASGAIAAPARSALGWHVMHVDAVEKRAERTLDQVRGELATQIATEKRRTALNDLSARMEEEFDNGGNLADAAKELGLTLQLTPAVTADGQVYGQQGQTIAPALARLVQTAFAMERENQPQIAEVEAGKTFVMFDVTSITPSAPAPLADISNDVAIMLALESGAGGAKAAADKVLAQARKGVDLAAAMASIGVPLPPVDRISMGREQLQVTKGQVPPPLMLLFSMAKGTTKLLPAPNNRGWYIVSLKEIVPGKVDAKDPAVASAQRELGQLLGREYTEQMSRAIRAEVGVTRNEATIRAIRTQLSGGN